MLYPISIIIDAYIQADSLEEAKEMTNDLQVDYVEFLNNNDCVELEQIEVTDVTVIEAD